ncbi:hypothetical protein Aca07nite_48330 [Actinoplanes capillaceus]|uniref:Uncharacterized protein n=1 Tax=Actinoplanes campanulatus TaxID=113559 RepID=A0ABQ3WMT3_9ACTN|nr:hypothetical protein [Actinoplanes capillaceus]GID47558.1 hypothetical protein Aca07nite_48330 [Actinoplanes capillaceus]
MITTLSRSLITTAVSAAVLVGTAGSAVAATNTLTVTAINRSGAKVAVTTTVVNLSSAKEYRVRTGVKRTLPKGNYAVLARISTGSAHTLGGRTVKVSGASKLTIDARQGRLVNTRLSPAPAVIDRTQSVRICSEGGTYGEVEATAFSTETVYVIPSASKYLSYAALSHWKDTNLVGGYATLHQTKKGVPSNPAPVFATAKLGTVTVDSRRGPSASNSAEVAVQPVGGGCGDHMFANLGNSDQPTTGKLRLSAGKWDIRGDGYGYTTSGEGRYISTFNATRTIAAGKSYFLRFFSAAWGPGTGLPATYQGRIVYELGDMLADPYFTGVGGTYGGEGTVKVKASLKLGGKTLKTFTNGPNTYGIDYRVKKAGWYTLTSTGTRYEPGFVFPAGMLSTATSVVFRFYAKKNTSGLTQTMAVQHVPAGLNGYNQAKPGSTTNVALRLSRYLKYGDMKKGPNPKLKSLSTKISTDGGRTWRSVPVRKINGVWHAIVPNPAAGAVSLRTRATYTNGGYTEATVFRAYAIG